MSPNHAERFEDSASADGPDGAEYRGGCRVGVDRRSRRNPCCGAETDPTMWLMFLSCQVQVVEKTVFTPD